ncbi:disease resistance protein RML1B-like [Neltuma alba]|uniref:disease resistance protein RML1B-like n=1 Tax=Neltuma alba TaxID=207710 RepID=UPI0010A3EDCB|nr:disease resistance protein RML1B-like [Prosopis alba]
MAFEAASSSSSAQLEEISLTGSSKLEELSPSSSRLVPERPPSIANLNASDCKSLEIVSTCRPSGGQPVYFSFKNCVQLNEQSLPNIMEAAAYSIPYFLLHKNKNYLVRFLICVAGNRVPEWFKYRAAQSSVIVELPRLSDFANFFFCTFSILHSALPVAQSDRDMALLATSSSFSAQSLPKKYDVFISFRGEDTRSNFTSHLYDAFRRKGIRSYIDSQLVKGDEISPSLLLAIEDSYASVVVFSENYASSRWCLDELTHILHCKRVQGQIVVPVFYKVEPSHVRNQTGVFEQAFENYERDLKVDQHKMQMWKQTLHEAANLAGYDSHTFRDESELIQKIVKDMLQKLNHKYPPAELKGLVGIDDNCKEIESLLKDAKSIGIWGMGGIGKSTIAKFIFLKYSSHYEGSCFLENVREKSQNGIAELRHKFLSCMLKEDLLIDATTTFLETRLSRMKVFVVLDDISTLEQLEYLVGGPFCFGPGSKILITTRDKHALSKGVDIIYKVKELKFHQSLELFSLNALSTSLPIMGYEELTKTAVVYAQGIPLALKVLGSYLRGRSEIEWKSALRKLEKSPHKDIQKVLRWSYDGLDEEERKIFLDIACFLKGELTEIVISLLDSFGLSGAIGIRTLHDKALIDVYDGLHVKMHDLIQAMGLKIACEESIDEPERHSRLCNFEEIYDVLANNMGSKKVEGIKLDVSQIKDLHLGADIFKKMPNMRILKFYSRWGPSHVHLPEGLRFLPNKMRYLEWYGFPLKSLPSTFCPEKLVKLSMRNSHLQKLWNGVHDFVSLQEIDLSGSKQLQELPNLSKCLNLKVVRLVECESLYSVHSSILSLHSLVQLDLYKCKKLESLKSELHLESLKDINVQWCWNLKEFSVSSNKLRELNLESTAIKILHPSVVRSSKLEALSLGGSRLVNLPNQLSCLTSLTVLRLYGCQIIDDLKLHIFFDSMLSLRVVVLDCCRNIIDLPNNTKHLLGLRFLSIRHCRRLRSLPELPPSIARLDADYCESLEIVSPCRPSSGDPVDFSFQNCMQLNEQSLHNIMDAAAYSIRYCLLHKDEDDIDPCWISVPGSRVPEWIKYRAAQSSVIVELPPLSDSLLFFFCIVVDADSESNWESHGLKCSCYLEGFDVKYSVWEEFFGDSKSDHVFIWDDSFTYEEIMDEIRRRNQQLFANMKLHFEFSIVTHEAIINGERKTSKPTIKECGVWPVSVSECPKFVEEMEMERKRKRPRDVEEQQPPLRLKKMDTLL